MSEFGFLSVIPPILAIALALISGQVMFSLLCGLFVGFLIIHQGNPLSGFLTTLESIVNVFGNPGNARIIIFTLLIGALLQLMKFAGGISGFVGLIQRRLEAGSSPAPRLRVAAALTGFTIFVESNISILSVGTTFRSVFDRYKISRAKLAYLADSSSAPACILFPLNAWGAYVIGLLAAYESLDPLKVLVLAIPFNFYAVLTLCFVFYIAWSGRDFGPMKSAEQKAAKVNPIPEVSDEPSVSPRALARNMIVPLAVMIFSMPVFLVMTGWEADNTQALGQRVWQALGNGSGSSAVMYAVASALLVLGVWLGLQRQISVATYFEQAYLGMKDILIMAILMALAFAIANLCRELGTGAYVASITQSWLSPVVAPALLFLTSAFVAFATGTSWGTFAIMISIAVPLADAIGLNLYMAVAAVLGGGVFGDHCSPISDTTLVASMAAGCDHIEHVNTQLPYALVVGSLATALYLIVGAALS